MKDTASVLFEDLHGRMEEIEKTLKGASPEALVSLLQGATAAIQGATDAKLDKILAAQRKDIETDTQVVEAVRELIASNTKLAESIRQLIETINTPTTRTSTINLPSGPVTLTTREN